MAVLFRDSPLMFGFFVFPAPFRRSN